jgi:peptidoglycan/LPS O-acetylase OafA/YrhL
LVTTALSTLGSRRPPRHQARPPRQPRRHTHRRLEVRGTETLTDAYRRYREARRFASLDGLRALAIVPVIWHHATLGPLPGLLGKGPIGVDLFFAISGFLITTLLLREQDEHAGVIAAGDFYARRALRIFPLYYGTLLLYVVYAACFMAHGPQRSHFFRSLPWFLTYTTNWFVAFDVPHPVSFAFSWSLATEEQFYLLWPWVVMLGAQRRWVTALIALLLLCLGQCALLPPGGLAARIASSISPSICMGALAALLCHSVRGFAVVDLLLGRSAPLCLLVVVLTLVFDVPLWSARLALTSLVVACAVSPAQGLAWLLEARAVRWIGTVSYGMYLFHVPLIIGARRVLPTALGSPGWIFLLSLPLTVGVASASYLWVERPLLGLRARFRP